MKRLLLTISLTVAAAMVSFANSATLSTTENRKNRENPDTHTTKEVTTAKVEKQKFNHWSLSLGGGISVFDGDGNTVKTTDLFPSTSPGFSFKGQVEYAITPSWGLNLTYNYLPYNGYKGINGSDFIFAGLAHDVSLGASVNLLNLFSPCRYNTKWSLNANLGLGVSFYDVKRYGTLDDRKQKQNVMQSATGESLVFPVGLDVEYAAAKWLGVYFELQYRLHSDDKMDMLDQGHNNDYMGYIGLGLRWKIGGQKQNRPHVRNIAVCEYSKSRGESAMESAVKDVAALNTRVTELSDRLEKELIPAIEEIKRSKEADEKDSDGDGVPDSRDRHPNTPAGSFVNYYGEPLTDAEIEKIMGDKLRGGSTGSALTPTVYFNTNSTQLTQAGRITVAEVANKLFSDSHLYVEVIGYCDNVGDAEYNKALSLKRAETVKQELIKKYGIDESRITVTAKGAMEGPTKNFMVNRRCELVITKK